MSVVNFKVSGSPAVAVDATSNFTTDPFDFKSSSDWAVALIETGLVGAPTFSVEVSTNQTKWYEWDALSTNVAIDDSPDADYMSFAYMRIVYLANGASAGTIEVELSFNNDRTDR